MWPATTSQHHHRERVSYTNANLSDCAMRIWHLRLIGHSDRMRRRRLQSIFGALAAWSQLQCVYCNSKCASRNGMGDGDTVERYINSVLARSAATAASSMQRWSWRVNYSPNMDRRHHTWGVTHVSRVGDLRMCANYRFEYTTCV